MYPAADNFLCGTISCYHGAGRQSVDGIHRYILCFGEYRSFSAAEHPVCADRHIRYAVNRLVTACGYHSCSLNIVSAHIDHRVAVVDDGVGVLAVA